MSNDILIGLSGWARAGKDTCAQHLVEKYGFERHGFADALRESLYALNPWIRLTQEEARAVFGARAGGPALIRLRELVDRVGWEAAKSCAEVRESLQHLGKEGGRDVIGEDVWVRALLRRYAGGRWVISDVRFPNEANAIADLGGSILRVHRLGFGPLNDHASETSLDDYRFDAHVNNVGTLEDLPAALIEAIFLATGEEL